jgi:hypothetical protein
MEQPSRVLKISRRSWLVAGLVAPFFSARGAETLAVTFDGDNLHVSDLNLHFLTGKSLQRMKDGASVLYLTQLTLFSDGWITPMRRTPVQRFVVSYDVWEEGKFSITMPGAVPRSAVDLSAQAAEVWCLENLVISALGLAPDRPFWLRLEMRSGEPKDFSSVLSESGISLRSLMLLLGRKPGADDAQWTREAGPLHLADLTRTPGRGARSG